MEARVLKVSATIEILDRLTNLLSKPVQRYNWENLREDLGEKELWDYLGDICPRFHHSPPYETLRVMSFLPFPE
ncbi:MAG: hypothetical protein A2563_01660 [Candidatus Magasanikbacteria bacterium RIFOXYD1_FULL_40_23]|uniref:Uncharacterized protein n=1 Tax=Candidatus Magasanikbacteria bacterium RIFOXYD1_FULL_40_23 TaxID=1798705 RepID=A0A1F6PBF3_9BACT|nr:MAG: hypothetical protein A2563_01660 [Candidatus Magasanikbacteria bacterium RIFOXYD1_FULL_40_23]